MRLGPGPGRTVSCEQALLFRGGCACPGESDPGYCCTQGLEEQQSTLETTENHSALYHKSKDLVKELYLQQKIPKWALL
ncbi:unnamed protein product [Caretta caretta]